LGSKGSAQPATGTRKDAYIAAMIHFALGMLISLEECVHRSIRRT
jgi:hypothetical protein